MRESRFTLESRGPKVVGYRWEPAAQDRAPRAAVLISHGMAEHAGRYRRFGEALAAEGYAVYAHDHRGHGETAGSLTAMGVLGEDGFAGMVDDMALLSGLIRRETADAPLFLFAHSMGTIVGQWFAQQHGEALAGAIFSGAVAHPGRMLAPGLALARLEEALRPHKPSRMMTALTFGPYNAAFRPVRTPFDWLTRDEAEVRQFMEDPLCGVVLPAEFYARMLEAIRTVYSEQAMRKTPRELPMLFVSGDRDPTGAFGRGIQRLAEQYRHAGVRSVDVKLYPEARHELLNELNREEVTRDLIAWMNARRNTIMNCVEMEG
ncbi:alpha/beta fold hydrolase [Paenibacillus turpanensis]|uniref:alpha/beta fold hydrolase n=1 Tax=Paenibacillus turpanensis TaxID=2689078 RepID=UPI001FB7E5DD|nr:alpha/beta fold hydrolase [Paenibacillus turpanensis]